MMRDAPDGWKLVPVEETEEMLDAANGALQALIDSVPPEERPKRWPRDSGGYRIRTREKMSARYRAMLSAAPPAPAAEVSDEMVEAALESWYIRAAFLERRDLHPLEQVKIRMRAALTAALAMGSGETERCPHCGWDGEGIHDIGCPRALDDEPAAAPQEEGEPTCVATGRPYHGDIDGDGEL